MSVFMNYRTHSLSRNSSLATNKVLRDTYALLGMSLLFSAATAWISMLFYLPHPGFWGTLIGFYGLYFLVHYHSNSALGVLAVFLFTGFTGYTLGPLLNAVLKFSANGSAIISMALTMTAAVFLGLSFYVLSTRRDFGYMGGMISIAAIVAMIAALFFFLFPSAILELMVSSAFALISSAYILYHTSEIIHGGERNYILATVSLYISIYNLFISLIRILTMFSNRD